MNLFEQSNHQPLAERIRPASLSDVIGQEHLVGDNQFLKNIIELKKPVSMILWGPPGTGKTTLARIIATSSGYVFEELSAVTSGLADVKKVIQQASERKKMGQNTLLFVDEIHRFNKAQQDAFLPHMENGTIVLIGATTENPSFEVIAPLLSRSRVVILKSLSRDQILKILQKGSQELTDSQFDPDALALLADISGGDARVALNGLEAAAAVAPEGLVTRNDVKKAMQKTGSKYDKGGEYHYNIISAFIKSMRGGAIDASLYYLARMIESGEDPKFIARRLVIFASEDVGEADQNALSLAVAGFQAIERIGMPEGKIILSQVTVAMAKAPKSRSTYNGINAALDSVRRHPDAEVPLHLRNAETGLMKQLGYGEGYEWKSGFKHDKGFMPSGLEDERYYFSEEV